MARIDTDQTNDELEKKIKRMESKLSHSRNKIFGCLNFALYLIIILTLLFGYGSFLLAKSGVKHVPILSDKYYEEPKPTERVDITNYKPSNLIKEVLSQTKDNFDKGESNSFAKINLDDQFITYQLFSLVSKHIKSINEVQATVGINDIDLYIKSGNYIYTAKVTPSFKDGKIKLDVNEIYLGEIKLPSFLGNIILKTTTEGLINNLNDLLKVFGQIKNIEINNRVVEVILLVNKNAKILNVF